MKKKNTILWDIGMGTFLFFGIILPLAKWGDMIFEPKQKEVPMVYTMPTGKCEIQSPELVYRDIYTPDIQNLKLNWRGAEIVKALCYKNVSEIAEDAYNAPPNFLLGLSVFETEATEFLGNPGSSVQGVLHTTEGTATDFGLEVLSETEIREYFKKNGQNPAISNHDERFNVVLNFDAAGRMIDCWRVTNFKQLESYKLGSLEKAFWRWRSLHLSYDEVKRDWHRLMKIVTTLNDPQKIIAIEEKFNQKNPKLLIDGKPAKFKDFIKAMQLRNANFGLLEYMEYLKHRLSQRNEALGETTYEEEHIVPLFYFINLRCNAR